jgi:hypothetical protein
MRCGTKVRTAALDHWATLVEVYLRDRRTGTVESIVFTFITLGPHTKEDARVAAFDHWDRWQSSRLDEPQAVGTRVIWSSES